MLGEFTWFWRLLGSIAAVLIVIGEFMARRPWRVEFWETNSLLIGTPWGGFELAHEGCDFQRYERWTGVHVWRRIPGTMDTEMGAWGDPSYLPQKPIFQTVYRHELRRF